MKFLTAGVPISSKKSDTISGLNRILELNLDGMELEFVRSIRMNENKAKEVKELSTKYNFSISVHAPYYINLASDDKTKLKNSINFIIQSCKIGYLANAKNVVFHLGQQVPY